MAKKKRGYASSKIREPAVTSYGRQAQPKINTLSPEILLQIFKHVASDWENGTIVTRNDKYYLDDDLDQRYPPASLVNVCTYWYSVCLSDKDIWLFYNTNILCPVTQPNAVRILRTQLKFLRESRNSEKDRYPGVELRLWSTNKADFDYEMFDTTFSKAMSLCYRRYGKSGQGKITTQERWHTLEKTRMAQAASVIKDYSDDIKTIFIFTVFNESQPDFSEIFGNDPTQVENVSSIELASARRLANPGFGHFIKTEMPRYARPSQTGVYPATRSSKGTVPAYPDLNQAIPVPVSASFFNLRKLRLYGRSVVSFCRNYLTLNSDGKSRRHIGLIPSKCRRYGVVFSILFAHVKPQDGGDDTPFTLDEFLRALRVLCGTYGKLELHHIDLPRPSVVSKNGPTVVPAKRPLRNCQAEFSPHKPAHYVPSIPGQYNDWPVCCTPAFDPAQENDGAENALGSDHIQYLYEIVFKDVSGSVLEGVNRLLMPHLRNDSRKIFEVQSLFVLPEDNSCPRPLPRPQGSLTDHPTHPKYAHNRTCRDVYNFCTSHIKLIEDDYTRMYCYRADRWVYDERHRGKEKEHDRRKMEEMKRTKCANGLESEEEKQEKEHLLEEKRVEEEWANRPIMYHEEIIVTARWSVPPPVLSWYS